MSSFRISEAMDLEDGSGNLSSSCSICFDPVVGGAGRSIAKLQCGHEFHLDCIGSAFNMKGEMQCPNCRNVENGRWLLATGSRSADFDPDVWDDIHELSYPELPFGTHWCPFNGITQLASLLQEAESQINSYHDAGNGAFGERSSTSTHTHVVCPHLAYAFPHAIIHSGPPLSTIAADSVSENSSRFSHNHPTNLEWGRGQPYADLTTRNTQNNEPLSHHPLPFPSVSSAADHQHISSQYGQMVPNRSDGSIQQSLASFAHPYSYNGSSSQSARLSAAAPVHAHALGGHVSNHQFYHHNLSPPLSSLGPAPVPPPSRQRPSRAPSSFTAFSSSSSASASTEPNGFYGFPSVSGTAERNPQDSENSTQHYDHFYRWGGRDGSTPLPWIPFQGESPWWSAFNPNQPPQSGGMSFLQRAGATERVTQSQPENGSYQQLLLPSRMPPPHYM